jgi:bifunctional UDP-N-acetylglucosamine pyrophosphorylase / glucosamine-1-phosphate N-acetyltransferase
MAARKAPPARRARAAPPRPPLAVVILAAGEGKRMRSALPKVLQPLAGRPLLAHVLATARALAPQSIYVVYGHGGAAVRAALGGEPVQWILQAERLGTGHAVQQAMQHIADGQEVLVLYGDVPLISLATLKALLAAGGRDRLALLTVMLADPAGYGRIVRNAHGLVRQIVEEKDATARQRALRECNTGVLAAPAQLLRRYLARLGNSNSQGEYYLTDVIGMAVKERHAVRALRVGEPSEVLGVNDRAQLAELEAAVRARSARSLLLAGVTLADPARVDVRGTLSHGSDVYLDVNTVFEGTVTLGDRVRIGPGCLLRDCHIEADTEVMAYCVIEGAHVGAECRIGPFARVRPATEMATGVHIGNFVEVKNSQLGAASKANHLSYVGDARLGQRVNIGAGTIIANYDGAVKHNTTVGDDAHTGSNSVLVAPITVGRGATIAAGSTVTHSVPAGKLTVARARQVTVEEWQRPLKAPK